MRARPPARRCAPWAQAQQHGLRALARGKLGPGYGLGEHDALVETLADQAEAVGLQRFEHQLAYAAQRSGLLQPRRPLNVPVLALSAALDRLCPPEHSEEILSLTTGAALASHHSLPGAGQLFPMQQAAWAAGRLQRCLTQIEETQS